MRGFVVLTASAFFQAVFSDLVPRYGSTRLRYESDCIGVIASLSPRYWSLALRNGLFWLMEKNDVNPALGLLAFALANEIGFDVADNPG